MFVFVNGYFKSFVRGLSAVQFSIGNDIWDQQIEHFVVVRVSCYLTR